MAGESPDKSEQRKSSGETTPGERDPRLAVFRESAARPNQDDGAALDAGHVDQPTAIFKMPTKTPPEEPTKPSVAPEGDARLRAAVAAWVATSDGDTPDADESGAASAGAASDDAAAGTAPDGDAGTAPARASADAAANEAGEASADAAAGADSDGDEPSADATDSAHAPAASADADASATDGAAADGDEPSADESAPDAGAAARSDELSPDTDTPDESDAQASGAEDVRSGASDDAPSAADSAAAVSQSDVDVSSAKDGRAASEPDASDADAVPGSEDGSGDGATAGAAAGSRADADVSGADAESESEGGSGSGAEAGASAARAEGGRVAAGRGESAADDDVPRGGGAPGGPVARAQEDAEASEAEDGSGRTALGGDAEAESASEGGSGAGAVGGPAADAQADVEVAEAEDGSGRTGEAESAADGGSGGGAAGGQGDAGGAGGGVDQATAVFKAVRPRAAIDQPTTALKSVGPPKAPKPAPKPAPESAAERTSKFVPLIKPDDVRPPARKPESPQSPQGAGKPAAPAPGALPEAERTRQQPLPPLPPLDLLAELTNTPPPPETPVRNALRRVKIWTPLVLLLVIVFAVVQFLRPLPAPALALTAKATYTFEGGALDMPWPEEGQSAVEVQGVGSIGTHGAQKAAPIASVTKAMTAYVILKEHPLKGDDNGPKITVDEQAEKESKAADESTAAIKEGQEFTERQMLQLLMIPSGNNAARLLARWDADSEAEFVKKMNDAAKDLGMKNTTYTDPSGLDATTVSTATDQLKLAKAVMENDVFQEIVNTPEIEIPGIDGKIYNNNKILLEPGVSGVKTGSSTPAGGNLLWSADTIVDGKKRRIVGAVMGQQTGTTLDSKLQLAITNSLKLIQAAQRDVTSATVVKKGDVVGYVDDGLGGQTPVVATKNLNAVGWPGLKVELAISDSGKPLPHAAKAGTEVGQVTVGTGPGQVKAPVALQKDLVEPGFSEKLARVG
ncbi:D-alanyl-D-alanine carboxypeptidase [Streptomyces sp. ISL-98]|uniref:D-alanyl-D-alanine carboxypeptidase family protein n=1 Tax=Streptomyces sp. ISL-98 TaxID=2819192 RepID=UPI0027E5A1CF|nr:D-alanyl-D-alanine carboxypeptidase [Streptomyces sp. ISL-98]